MNRTAKLLIAFLLLCLFACSCLLLTILLVPPEHLANLVGVVLEWVHPSF